MPDGGTGLEPISLVAKVTIHIGDAWHSASPQLGQGANMALLDAWALARSLREAASIADALTEAVRLRRSHVRLYQAMSALFTPVYSPTAARCRSSAT